MLLNNDTVDTEKADGIFPPVSVKDGFSGFFLHPYFKHSRSA